MNLLIQNKLIYIICSFAFQSIHHSLNKTRFVDYFLQNQYGSILAKTPDIKSTTMSYIGSTLGPSPFLTTSQHHYHSSNLASSGHAHYNTNSYTNTPTYLTSFANPASSYQEKYFPKETISVLPGISNLPTSEQDKLVNPLNSYSGNMFINHITSSPFDRGQIYYGKKDPKSDSTSLSSTSTLINQLDLQCSSYKKENPFHKKYLLSERNVQLQNYAFYSSSQNYELTEHFRGKKKTNRNVQKLPTSRDYENQEEIGQNILDYAKRMKPNDAKNILQGKNYYGSERNISSHQNSGQSKRFNFKNYISPEEYVVESEVDEKQFDSFGQGRQAEFRKSSDNQSPFSNQVDQGESIINGLTKMVLNDRKPTQKVGSSKNIQPEKSRKQPVFIDSEDDQRKSGTFKVPDVIIQEINNPRIPSTVMRRGTKENTSVGTTQRQRLNSKQKPRYSKQEAIQVGRNPPSRITMRGKTYEKITL